MENAKEMTANDWAEKYYQETDPEKKELYNQLFWLQLAYELFYED